MDFHDLESIVGTDIINIALFGVFFFLIAHSAIKRFVNFIKKEVHEKFDNHKKSAIILKHILDQKYIRIRHISSNITNSITYKIYPSKKNQILMIKPGFILLTNLPICEVAENISTK